MLQFLKDFQQNPIPENGNSQTAGQTPDSGCDGAAAGQANDNSLQYLTVGDKKGQLRKSTYLLAALFLIGVACLFVMIKKSTPKTASASGGNAKQAEQVQIENAISKITGIRTQMFSSLEKIVTKFYEFSNVVQVDVDELAKNPFAEDNYLGQVMPDDAQSRFAVLQDELELLSIMSTDRGYCCMINDKILYEGDSVKGLKITKITGNEVTLSSGAMNMTLKLSEEF